MKYALFFLVVIAICGVNSTPINDDIYLDYYVDTTETKSEDFICVEPIYDCNNNGKCLPPRNGDNVSRGCLCSNSYETHKPKDNTQCNYRRKDQLTAFLLHLFLGEVGAGHFYTENYDLAISTIVLLVVGALTAAFVVGIPMLIAVCGFWLHGVIVYAANSLKDGEGVSLASW